MGASARSSRPLFQGLLLARVSALFALLYMVCFLHTQWGSTSLAHHDMGRFDPIRSVASVTQVSEASRPRL